MIHPSEEILLGSCPPPRSRNNSTQSSSPDLSGVKLWGNLFKEISRLPTSPRSKNGYFEFGNVENEKDVDGLQLQAVDLRINERGSMNDTGAEVVLRRNSDFEFDLIFNKNVRQFGKKLAICFEKENAKKDDTREHFFAVLDCNDGKNSFNEPWPISFTESGDHVAVTLKLISEVATGIWRLVIYTGLTAADDESTLNHIPSNCVYTVRGIHVTD